MLHRFPQGIHHEDFYQKNNPQEMPDWVETVPVQHHHNEEPTDYLLCQNEATLIYMVNLGCLEMNPWSSRVPALDYPDWMIFDLDPVEIDFRKVVEVAQVFHAIFEGAGLPHYCKTSGKRGLHIAIPLGAQYANETVKDMALAVATLVHNELPTLTSLERSPSKRRRKVYLDYLQNGFGKTLASPYSLRPITWAGVSTPLHWDEVTPELDPKRFNCHSIFERLEKEGDIWKPLLTERIDLGSLL